MNEIVSNDVTSSESNWKSTRWSLVWKKHPRPGSKLFVSKSANVSITISSVSFSEFFDQRRQNNSQHVWCSNANFEPSIWDCFSSATDCTYFWCNHDYHDPRLGIKRHIQFFSRPSLASWQVTVSMWRYWGSNKLKSKDQLFDSQMGEHFSASLSMTRSPQWNAM